MGLRNMVSYQKKWHSLLLQIVPVKKGKAPIKYDSEVNNEYFA